MVRPSACASWQIPIKRPVASGLVLRHSRPGDSQAPETQHVHVIETLAQSDEARMSRLCMPRIALEMRPNFGAVRPLCGLALFEPFAQLRLRGGFPDSWRSKPVADTVGK